MYDVFMIVVGDVTTNVFVEKKSDVNAEMSISVDIKTMSEMTIFVSKIDIGTSIFDMISVSGLVTGLFKVKVETYVMIEVKSIVM